MECHARQEGAKQNQSTYTAKLTQQKRTNATAQTCKTKMGCRLEYQQMQPQDPRRQNEDMGSQT